MTATPQELTPLPQDSPTRCWRWSAWRVSPRRRPTISDVGTLAWSHIRHLVPRASLALFVVDSSRDEIIVQFAAGARGTAWRG